MNKIRGLLRVSGGDQENGGGSQPSLDTDDSLPMASQASDLTSSVLLGNATCPFFGHGEYVPVREMHAPVLGQVFLARRASDGAAVVVKTVERGPTVSSHVRAELLVHARCEGHPHVLQLLDVFLTDTHLALVMQRVAGGSLADCVTARGALPEPVARRFFQQYVAALGFLHSLGAEFREPRLDCKLLAPGPDAGPGADAGAVVKVQDFAYSKTEQINSDPNAALGSLPYTAPEVLANRIDSRRAVDVWGAGVGLYRMALGTFPFERAEDGTRSRDLVQKMLSRIASAELDIPEGPSPELRDLLTKMLAKAPEQRITLEEVMRHPWYVQDCPDDLLDVAAPRPPRWSEQELHAIVDEASTRTAAGLTVDDMADEILNEEEMDDMLDELDLDSMGQR